MKATSHNGRWGSERHNSRDFDLTHAKHIDQTRTADNMFWFWDCDRVGDMLGADARYYAQTFTDALNQQNSRYQKAGQTGRLRTMTDWLKDKNKAPEETIFQIGDMHDGILPNDFCDAVEALQTKLMEWSKANGSPFQILSTAIHLDEASPHAHMRRVWQYQDNGVWKIGQNKALEAAGVPLPDPTKPEGRKNNRKMTFDAMVRNWWLDICEQRGYNIEREPETRTVHLPKAQLIELHERENALSIRERAVTAQEAKLAADVRKFEKRVAETERLLEARETAVSKREKALSRREQLCGLAEQIGSTRKPLPSIAYDIDI